jgi:hypothetical protein
MLHFVKRMRNFIAKQKLRNISKEENGQEGIRTPDTVVRSHVL